MIWTENKIKELIKENKLYKFYKSKEWQQLKEQVLKENHYECAWCKEKGKIAKAETVHHVQYVKKHPDLAMQKYFSYGGKQYKNLVPLCHDCHDKAHGRIKYKIRKKPLTEERW